MNERILEILSGKLKIKKWQIIEWKFVLTIREVANHRV